jgi:hypothetical protein
VLAVQPSVNQLVSVKSHLTVCYSVTTNEVSVGTASPRGPLFCRRSSLCRPGRTACLHQGYTTLGHTHSGSLGTKSGPYQLPTAAQSAKSRAVANRKADTAQHPAVVWQLQLNPVVKQSQELSYVVHGMQKLHRGRACTTSTSYLGGWGEGGKHVDMFTHNKSGIAYRDWIHRTETYVTVVHSPCIAGAASTSVVMKLLWTA